MCHRIDLNGTHQKEGYLQTWKLDPLQFSLQCPFHQWKSPHSFSSSCLWSVWGPYRGRQRRHRRQQGWRGGRARQGRQRGSSDDRNLLRWLPRPGWFGLQSSADHHHPYSHLDPLDWLLCLWRATKQWKVPFSVTESFTLSGGKLSGS